MNRTLLNLVALAVCFFAFHTSGYGQLSPPADSISTKYPIHLFEKALAGQSRLNNGREYILALTNAEGHPFFETRSWSSGSVHYDGVLFNDVELLYDLQKDELVAQNFAFPNSLSLVTQKVKEFRVLDHHFVYLKQDSLRQVVQEGFYDQLYKNNLSVLARRKKIVEVARNVTRDAKFVQENEYYLVKEGVLFPVKSKASVLKLLNDRKTELQQYMKKNGILFKQDPEDAIVRMAAYYDQLSK